MSKRKAIQLTPTAPQYEVFSSDKRFRVLVAGRRFGKTWLACMELLMRAVNNPGSDCWYCAPTYGQAKGIAWKQLKKMIPEGYISGKPNETELSITLVGGSTMTLKGIDRPDTLRGVGLDFLVCDEFQVWKDALEVFNEVLYPMMTDRKGSVLFIGTPQGYNWMYDFYMRGMSSDHPNWESWQYTTMQGGRVAEAELEQSKLDLDPRQFAQEFMASFETLSHRVYSNFERKKHIDNSVEVLPGETIWLAVDFNIHPMSCIFGVRRKKEEKPWFHMFDEIILDSSNTEELCQAILQSKWATYEDKDGKICKRRFVVCPDPSGKSRRTSAGGVTDFSIMESNGFIIHSPRRTPKIVDTVNNVQGNLKNAKGEVNLLIHSRCRALIKGLEGFTYKKGTSIPDKTSGLDHITDALKYLLWQECNLFKSKARMMPWSI